MLWIGIGSDSGTHVKEQSIRGVLFGNIIANDAESVVEAVEYCIANAPGVIESDSPSYDTLDSLCNVAPIKTVYPDKGSSERGKGGNETAFMRLRDGSQPFKIVHTFSPPLNPADVVYVGGRAVNFVGMWSPFVWSNATTISGVVAVSVPPAKLILIDASVDGLEEASTTTEASDDGANITLKGTAWGVANDATR